MATLAQATENFVIFGHLILEICEQTDRHTYKHADHNTSRIYRSKTEQSHVTLRAKQTTACNIEVINYQRMKYVENSSYSERMLMFPA